MQIDAMLYCAGENDRKKNSACVQYKFIYLFLNIFYSLVESMNMKPADIEGQL